MTAKTEWLGPVLRNPLDTSRTTKYQAASIVRDDGHQFEVGVGDFVHLISGGEEPFVGRIMALWQEGKEKSVQINWLYREKEVSGTLRPTNMKSLRANELLYSTHEDPNPLETIIETTRIRLINSTTGSATVSRLYADPPSLNVSKEPTAYECSTFYDVTNSSLTPLTAEQIEELSNTQQVRKSTSQAVSAPSPPSPSPNSSSSTKPTPRSSNTNQSAAAVAVSGPSIKQLPAQQQMTKSTVSPESPEPVALDPDKLVEHASRCTNASCPVVRCGDIKATIDHNSRCAIPNCGICKRFLDNYVIKHAKHCTTPRNQCPVKTCEQSKPSTKIEHACECTGGCSFPDCGPAKRMLGHVVQGCVDPSTCRICSKFNETVRLHEFGCSKRCNFPNCAHFSRSLLHSTEACARREAKVPCARCWLFQKLLSVHVERCDRKPLECNFPGCKGRALGKRAASTASSGASGAAESHKNMRMDSNSADVPSRPSTAESRPSSRLESSTGQVSRRAPTARVSYAPPPSMKDKKFSGVIRIGPEYQAQIPPFQGYRSSRTLVPYANDETLWSPRNSVSSADIQKAVSSLEQEVRGKRGAIVAVPVGKIYMWARTVHPSRAPIKDTLRVIPATVSWPKDPSPSSFVGLNPSHILEVESAVVRFSDTLQEQALLDLHRGRKPSIGQTVDVLAQWTEEEFDTYCKAMKDGQRPFRSIASSCGKTFEDLVELMYRLHKNHSQSLPPGMMACSLCGDKSLSTTMCKRFFACQSSFCQRCFHDVAPKKKKDTAREFASEDADTNEGMFFCPLCTIGTETRVQDTHIAAVSDSFNPLDAWIRRVDVTGQRSNRSLVLTSGSLTGRGPLQNHPAAIRKTYLDNESIFRDYDDKLISAEDALDSIRDLLISRSQKTLGMLSSGVGNKLS